MPSVVVFPSGQLEIGEFMGYKEQVDDQSPEVKAALELCDTILGKIEDLPSPAFDFGASIEEKVTGMRAWIDQNSKVTDKMNAALENMLSGVNRWLHEED